MAACPILQGAQRLLLAALLVGGGAAFAHSSATCCRVGRGFAGTALRRAPAQATIVGRTTPPLYAARTRPPRLGARARHGARARPRMLFDAPSRFCTDVATAIAKWWSPNIASCSLADAIILVTRRFIVVHIVVTAVSIYFNLAPSFHTWLHERPTRQKTATNGKHSEDERMRELELEERRLAFEERRLALEERRLAFDEEMRTRERALEERRLALDEELRTRERALNFPGPRWPFT
ncbi:hypothetical protein KFE25_012636 [Diacronema lutheri]|uniref:Uncharacterized protein n=1 Tax=Diacronema lutheri TaxID=2081491 RepID=A0A8J5X7R5_DIALT|nr:hypothetical protein KFE25_012636 [Diacronema lutheri]